MNPLAMMLDLSSRALSAAEAMFAAPERAGADWHSGRFPIDPMPDLLAAMTGLASAMIERLPEFDPMRAFGPPGSDGASAAAELRELMIRTFVATAGSSLRYWRELAELYARKVSLLQSEARRALGELPPSQAERVLLDELRGMFRELADVGLTEAARLGAELEQIGGSVLDAAGASAPSGPYQRRWRAKD